MLSKLLMDYISIESDKNLTFGDISPEFCTLDSISLRARTALSPAPCRKGSCSGREGFSRDSPRWNEDWLFSRPNHNEGWLPLFLALLEFTLFTSMVFWLPEPLHCPAVYTANSEWIIRHTRTCSPPWSRDTLTQLAERMRKGRTAGQRVGIKKGVLETDVKWLQQ